VAFLQPIASWKLTWKCRGHVSRMSHFYPKISNKLRNRRGQIKRALYIPMDLLANPRSFDALLSCRRSSGGHACASGRLDYHLPSHQHQAILHRCIHSFKYQITAFNSLHHSTSHFLHATGPTPAKPALHFPRTTLVQPCTPCHAIRYPSGFPPCQPNCIENHVGNLPPRVQQI